MNIIKSDMLGENKESINCNSAEFLELIKNLSDKESIELDLFYNLKNTVLQNFILVFLEYKEKKGNKKATMELSDKDVRIELDIDFYDIFVNSKNNIIISDKVILNLENINKVFIFDNYLCIKFKSDYKEIVIV